MLDIHTPHATAEHNVQGIERLGSLAGGALMISKGLRHGGLIGMLQVAAGGLALARGVSGHCSAKAWWLRHRAEYNHLRGEIDRGARELKALKDSAEAAVREVTVTGKDPLVG